MNAGLVIYSQPPHQQAELAKKTTHEVSALNAPTTRPAASGELSNSLEQARSKQHQGYNYHELVMAKPIARMYPTELEHIGVLNRWHTLSFLALKVLL